VAVKVCEAPVATLAAVGEIEILVFFLWCLLWGWAPADPGQAKIAVDDSKAAVTNRIIDLITSSAFNWCLIFSTTTWRRRPSYRPNHSPLTDVTPPDDAGSVIPGRSPRHLFLTIPAVW